MQRTHISSHSLSSVKNGDPFCGFIIFIQAHIWIILKSMNLLRFFLFPGRIHISPSSFCFYLSHHHNCYNSVDISAAHFFSILAQPTIVTLRLNLRICKSLTKRKDSILMSTHRNRKIDRERTRFQTHSFPNQNIYMHYNEVLLELNLRICL